jgi:hypothetical protein
VQDALPIVIVAVVVVAGLVGVAALVLSRGPYEQIGRDGMTFDRDAPAVDTQPIRDAEIAQMLAAGNARRAAKGLPPLELASLQPPDESLRAEIRAHVEARSARLVARGRPPLDIDAEVERRLSGQDG